ncbi:MAG TPA: TonB-dependent receptor plug domain-containing protein [Pseudomonadales bacterium]|nr:TonB-dependent receptor plug domain-containing protein [Pseudomonadales bacterium]
MKNTSLVTTLFLCQAFAVFADENPATKTESDTTLSTVVVTANRDKDSAVSAEKLANKRLMTSDSAQLLDGEPGVSFYTGGGVSSLPVIDGLADDRIRLLVDGMSITSSCPNHMNPALSYVDPTHVDSIEMMAGITPVSVGGDSIGGTIVVNTVDPVFADSDSALRTAASVSTFYRSNGNVSGESARASLADENFSIGYSGSTVKSENYSDGNGKAVRSTEYESNNNQLTLATRFDNHLLVLDLGWQDIPYQGYANQFMDMTSNRGHTFNLRYTGDYNWGELEARIFRQSVRHHMDMLDDKADLGVITMGMPYAMPMDTKGVDKGYVVQGSIPYAEQSVLRIGNEYHLYTLDDWWPPIAGSMMMGPNPFWNINDGRRERIAVFAEQESHWNTFWSSQLGVRYERVNMNTGDVQGYYSTGDDMGMGMGLPDGYTYQNDANAFNAQNHKQSDNNIDLTAVARYEPDANSTYDVGVARKTRSPNLYERYTWSNEASMAGAMNSWFGDLNSYVGDIHLDPEVAYTLRTSADWHDSQHSDWQIKVEPFYTHVDDYINVDPNLATTWPANPGRAALRFANHEAELYGADITGRKLIGHAGGDWSARAVLNYVRGQDLDNGGDLYNIMPLNARIALEHSSGNWNSSLELQGVMAKDSVDAVRKELKTAGYSLVNLRTSYNWGKIRLDAGIDNLFDKQYDLPLGGVDFYEYNYLSPVTDGHLTQVNGMGRSANVGLTVQF